MKRGGASPLQRLARAPLFPWIFATYPALQLAAYNILQIDIREVSRPLIFSWLIATAGYLVLLLIFRRASTATFVLLFGLLAFFTYGHLYQWLRVHPIVGISLGRHRFLLIGYGLMMGAAIVLARRAASAIVSALPWLNALALVLLILPSAQIANHLVQSGRTKREVTAASIGPISWAPNPPSELPDIYYIILDTYTRSDALQRDYGYDNSWFLNGLRDLGFYVADCSRSNYGETLSSVTSALNLDYLTKVRGRLDELGLDPRNIFALLKQSLVRSQLESLGYQTVAFQTGFDWSDMQDADIYLSLSEQPLNLQLMSPFEVLFVETTGAKLLLDTQYLLKIADFGAAEFRHRAHVELQLNILEELPRVPAVEGPTFTFAHVLVPHIPIVFEANGDIVSDPGYYSGDKSAPIDHDYLVRGYANQVAFISDRMLAIAKELLRASEVPPVIIIQGDTGFERDNKMQILNVYYAPEARPLLYSSMSPVNSFRAIFNAYFGTDYERLPDDSYQLGDAQPPAPETSPACLAN